MAELEAYQRISLLHGPNFMNSDFSGVHDRNFAIGLAATLFVITFFGISQSVESFQ